MTKELVVKPVLHVSKAGHVPHDIRNAIGVRVFAGTRQIASVLQ